MSVKSAVLTAATLGVVALAVYLFVQVRAAPAQSHGTQVASRRQETSQDDSTPPAERPSEKPAGKPGTAPTKNDTPTGSTPEIGTEVDGPPGLAGSGSSAFKVKLDSLMEQANKFYDSQDFDNATAIATKVLTKDPGNVRMLRIIVSANCIQGDSVVAQKAYEQLPKFDRDQMKARCDRYGISFKEPAD